MAAAAVVTSAAASKIGGVGARAVGGTGTRIARRKQRCWLFQVDGVLSNATEVELLASIRERYTTVKRLVVRPVNTVSVGVEGSCRNVVVEVQFTGPQPSEGPGALLRDLLRGISVGAKPLELPRGRKKRPRTNAGASVEGSDSDAEDLGSRKMGGHRRTNSLGRLDDKDEEESPGGKRCITVTLDNNSGQGESPLCGGKLQDPFANIRRASSRDCGGLVLPSADLGALSSEGMSIPNFQSPCSSHGQTAVSPRAVVPADDSAGGAATALSGVTPPQLHPRVISDDALLLSPLKQQQLQAPSPKQFSRPSVGVTVTETGTGIQWDDVVRRMTTPPHSGHPFEMGSDNSSLGNGQATLKSENEGLAVTSSNNLGNWNSNDSQMALLDPMLPQPSAQLALREWAFDSVQVADSSGGSTVMDLSDVDGLLHGSAKGDATAAAVAAPASPPDGTADSNASSPMSRSSSADDGAGRMQHAAIPNSMWSLGGRQHAAIPNSMWSLGGRLPMEKVIIEPSRNECDFEGRPNPTANPKSGQGPIPASTDRQCHLVFTGLNLTGQDLRSICVTAYFGVDSIHKVGKVTSPVQIGADGRQYAGVYYPSMQEIWPELYSTSNIRVVEVDVVVEIRSDSEEYQYVGPQLKVTYLRSAPTPDASGTPPRPIGRRTASREPIPYNNDSQQVSYSCVDYSCGDWFSDMCQSVFRGGSTSDQPLHDDPNDLMSIDP